VEAINVFSVGVAVILKFRIVGLKVNCFKYSAFSDINCVQYLEETEQEFCPEPARKLSANLYDIHHCCVYSEELLMMDRGTVRNM
jgi:hypothetical protein